jgi:superfamily II DNA/RNA helicase
VSKHDEKKMEKEVKHAEKAAEKDEKRHEKEVEKAHKEEDKEQREREKKLEKDAKRREKLAKEREKESEKRAKESEKHVKEVEKEQVKAENNFRKEHDLPKVTKADYQSSGLAENSTSVAGVPHGGPGGIGTHAVPQYPSYQTSGATNESVPHDSQPPSVADPTHNYHPDSSYPMMTTGGVHNDNSTIKRADPPTHVHGNSQIGQANVYPSGTHYTDTTASPGTSTPAVVTTTTYEVKPVTPVVIVDSRTASSL